MAYADGRVREHQRRVEPDVAESLGLAGATIEEKRELVGKYIRAVRAVPDKQRFEIRLYTALFNTVVAGTRFKPATFGL